MKTTRETKLEQLRLFEVFGEKGIVQDDAVAEALARLLASKGLELHELQAMRDIVQDLRLASACAYLFLATMFLSRKGGSAYLDPGRGPDLLKAAGALDDARGTGFEQDNTTFGDWVEQAWSQMAADGWPLGESLGRPFVQVDQGRFFFARDWQAVSQLNQKLGGFSRECPDAAMFQDGIDEAVTFSFGRMNKQQCAAVRHVVASRFTVLTGGPGTGKTTTVCAILRTFFQKGWTARNVRLAAPTGRAGQRMTESIRDQTAQAVGLSDAVRSQLVSKDLKGQTVHGLLGGYAPNFKYTEKNPLPDEVRLVIVDETSMIDLYLMRALLEALPKDCRLVLIGDARQLPSVDTGAILGDLTAMGGTDVVCLEDCNRAKGELAVLAKDMVEKDVDAVLQLFSGRGVGLEWEASESVPEGQSAFHWLEMPAEKKERESVLKFFEQWALHTGTLGTPPRAEGRDDLPDLVGQAETLSVSDESLTKSVNTETSRRLFKALNYARILTLVREGAYGAKGINDRLLRKRLGGKKHAHALSVPGVPVIVTRNTRERNLFNGDVGVTVRTANGMAVLFPRGEETVVCPVALLPEHELAYAMTVHKSQGSEFKRVLVVLPDDAEHPLLSREIVYTGITRAKECAVVLGTEAAVRASLARCIVRNTGVKIG